MGGSRYQPEWINDPHDIEHGMMRNPKWKQYTAADLPELVADLEFIAEALDDLFAADMATCMRYDGKDDQMQALTKAREALRRVKANG